MAAGEPPPPPPALLQVPPAPGSMGCVAADLHVDPKLYRITGGNEKEQGGAPVTLDGNTRAETRVSSVGKHAP